MSTLLIRGARVLTLAGPGPRRGAAMRDLGVIDPCDVLVEGGRIAAVGPRLATPSGECEEIDAAGRVLMPGLVDCHTHMCWSGSRVDEWERKLAGATYLDILRSGGGIMSTVRAVRAATLDDLTRATAARVERALRQGTTTVEVKSGYGLTTADELKMLLAIVGVAAQTPGTVVPTALLGHAIPPDVPREEFLRTTIDETLAQTRSALGPIAVDAFCESGAWTLEECVRLFAAAKAAGHPPHPIRVHADQFTSMGMVAKAIELGALSIDHLEATTPEDADLLGTSNTYGVILPLCGLHVDDRYANGRRLIDAGVALCVASNSNPGSAPSTSLALAAGLAVRKGGLTPGEAIAAITVNPATLLGLTDRGTIEPGKRADLVLLRHQDERALVYELESDHADLVIASGHIVKQPTLAR
jgi:imidazolonepropionase